MAETIKGQITSYIETYRIDGLVGSLMEGLIRDRPMKPVPYIIDHIYLAETEEIQHTLQNIKEKYDFSQMPADQANQYASYKKLTFARMPLSAKPEVDAEDLEEYLKVKKINSLFNAIVESLLKSMPASPCGFIIAYLHKHYTEETREVMNNIMQTLWVARGTIKTTRKKSIIGGPGAKEGESPDVKSSPPEPIEVAEEKSPYPEKSAMKETSSSSDTDDEDEDAIGEMTAIPSAVKPGPAGRRSSVSAESMDPKKLAEQKSKVADIPKTPEVTAVLRRVVGKSSMLKGLELEQKEAIVKAFAGPLIVKKDENVIVEGDMGDTFYLLEEGEVEVYKKMDGEDRKVFTYKPGDAFGQLAIMYNAPRAATCKVVSEEAKLWALDRISFKVIVVAAAMQKREKYQHFLSQVPLLESLTEFELMTLADSLTEEEYEDGAVICTQGEEGNDFYIILDGVAECTLAEEGKEVAVVAAYTEGQYFGEIALMSAKPRQATVTAVGGKLKVLAIDRATFIRVFGELEVIMQRMRDHVSYA